MTDLVSRVYRPSPTKCCEACAFGAPDHALWCPVGRIEQLKRDGHHHDDFLQHRWADDGGHIYHPDDFLQSRTNPSPGALIVIGVEMDLNVAGEGTADQLAAFDLATMRHAAQATR